MSPPPDPDDLARVADRALSEVRPGMALGLGTGRAAEAFIRRLGAAAAEGLSVVGVPTSERSERIARELGITVARLEEVEALDVAFDGADEVTPDASLTKGRGGAMLRERVVASIARRFVVLVTSEKLVDELGQRCPLPIEVVPFALPTVLRRVAVVGARAIVRHDDAGAVYRTDNGNAVVDLVPHDGAWIAPRDLDARVRAIPGVVDTGFFFDMASLILVGERGSVSEVTPPPA